jgi:hypothetical protein
MVKKNANLNQEKNEEDISISTENAKKGQMKKKAQPAGYNWYAVGFLILMTGTAVLTAGLSVIYNILTK